MRAPLSRKSAGFVLLEALIALLIVSVGLLAISKLEGLTISAAGEARSRSEAVTLAQKKLEQLRNWVTEAAYTAGMISGTSTYSGTNANYTYAWTITAGTSGTLVQLATTWKDRFATGTQDNQRIDLNSLVTWDNPLNQVKSESGNLSIGGPTPTGDAKRGDYSLRKDAQGNVLGTPESGPGNVHIYDNSSTGKTELLNSAGQVVLYLDKVGNTFQDFTTISGRIYFDQNAGNNTLPSSANVRVRLSSEGECFYDNTANNLIAVTAGSNSYNYFEYKCYVGSGWYGNVGIKIDDSVNGNAASPAICIGDPAFNSGVSNNTLTSAHPDTSATRTYRGFHGTLLNTGLCPTCLSTGVEPGRAIPNDGTVVPGTYTSASGANGAYNQYFLLTHLTGNATCNSKMTGGEFASNAGKYFCISPDNDAQSDICPNVWPGYTLASGGGTLNYSLTLDMAGSGSGNVTSSPAGVSCDTTANPSCTTQSVAFPSGSQVTLTPAAPAGSTFAGWCLGAGSCTGASCSGTGTCVVTMSGNVTVNAQFDIGTTTNNLSVAVSPSGGGTVTSVDNQGNPDGNINCPTTCSYGYTANSVTLHATPSAGYTFTGWSGGGCTGTSNCTVSMNSAQAVTATFAALPVNYALTVNKTGTGSGTVTYSAAGISCGSACSANIASGTVVTLTAAAGSTDLFIKWTGVTCSETTGNGNNQTQSNTQPTCTFTMTSNQTVAAQFDTTLCTTTISGSRRDVGSAVSVTEPASCTATTCSCTNDTTGTGYSCSVSAVSNTTIKLTDTWTGHNPATKTKSITANCQNNTGVNFN